MKMIRTTIVYAFGIMMLLVIGPDLKSTHAGTEGQKLLNELITKAKKEGELKTSVITSFTGRTGPRLAAAFKKRFGFDFKVSVPVVNPTRYAPKAAAEVRARAVPPFDTYVGSGKNAMQLVGMAGVERITHWESLLAEINPQVRSGSVRPKQISPDPFSGYAFQYLHRPRSILYNTKLISKEKLPKTHAELGDPKYKGKWVTPPYTSDWDTGLLVFPEVAKDQWIAIIRKAGRNAGAILSSRGSLQRVLLGEFSFFTAATHSYFYLKAKDPEAPLGISYFKDFNPVTGSYYVVRKGARHPAAATLFALWMGTPEAKAIWQPHTFYTQLWGETDLDKRIRKDFKDSGAKSISFFDSREGVELLRWYGTSEGRAFRKAMSQAIRGR